MVVWNASVTTGRQYNLILKTNVL